MIIEKLKNMIQGERQSSELSAVLTRLHKVEKKIETAHGAKLEELIAEKKKLDARFRQLLNKRSQSIEMRPSLNEVEYRGGEQT